MCVCRVAPVYRHIFPLSTAPTLSIIGLPWKVVPFPEFEVQAKWIARVLSNRVHLPSMDAMQAEVQHFYADLERQEVPARCGQLPEHALLLVLQFVKALTILAYSIYKEHFHDQLMQTRLTYTAAT